MLSIFLFLLFYGQQASTQAFSSFGTTTCGGCYGYGTVSHTIEETICSDGSTLSEDCGINGRGGAMATFSFDKSHLDPGLVDTDFTTGTLVSFGSLTYTNPTVYLDVYYFTWNDVYLFNNQCFTRSVYSMTLSPTFRYVVPTGKPATDVLRSAEVEFVESVFSQSSFCDIPLSTSPVPAPTSSVGTNPTTPASTTAPAPDLASNSGLSASSKIGLGIGLGIGGALLLALPAFFVWKRLRSGSGRGPEEMPSLYEADGKNNGTLETEGKTLNEADSKTRAAEIDGQVRHELVGTIPGTELPANNGILSDRWVQS